MKQQIDSFLATVLVRWVDAVRTHARSVVVACGLLTLVLGAYTIRHLGINSDNMALVSERLPSRRAHEEYIRHFPHLDDALFVVVDAENPELARTATRALADRMQQEPDLFTGVHLPGGGEFFERNGLLYRSADDLDRFADQMARIQPLVAELERDASIAHLAELVRAGLDEVADDGPGEAQWALVLDRVRDATVGVFEEFPLAASWEEILLEGSSLDVTTRRAIVAQPKLDYSSVLGGSRAIHRVRELARELDLVPERGVRVRLTGNPALNYEEMIGLAWDIGVAGIFCFAVVAVILHRALRSLRLVTAALVTLLVGLVWTAAFAAFAVGHLNLISISFAILFIGLGVDFGIHLGTGYADLLRSGRPHELALRETAAHVGGALCFCTLTTSIGFFVFVPTDYRGMAELGVIAGVGMFIVLLLSLTLIPALLSSWLPVRAEQLEAGLRFRTGWARGFRRHPAAVRRVSALIALGGLLLLPGVRFDPNALHMRDESTESVQAFQDLLSRSGTSPWFINVVATDLAEAEALARRLETLSVVDHAVHLGSYVPDDQEEKLEILSDIAYLFETPPGLPSGPNEPPSMQEQVQALRELHDHLESARLDRQAGALAASMRSLQEHLRRFLDRIEREGNEEAALRELEHLLLSSLPRQLERLRAALATDGIRLEDLPADLREHMLGSDGSARIQVYPSGDLRRHEDFVRFVSDVQAVAPGATGVSVNLVEFGRAIVESFQQALVSAVLIIAALLSWLWRRPLDVVLVMTPLLMAAICTGATMALLDKPFDFTNVCVIPLLLGVGVDSGIHLVQRAREGVGAGEDLLGTSTARAVYYSALTTAVSFGSLSFSAHQGMHNLGVMLTAGLAFNVMCILILLPALIELRPVSERITSSEPRA